MLKFPRHLFALVAMLSLASTASALEVRNYTATSFTTLTNNVRLIPILSIPAAVEFDAEDPEDDAIVCVVADDRGEYCSDSSAAIPLAVDGGTFQVSPDRNIIFTPDDPTFTGSASIDYEIRFIEGPPTQGATLTVVIADESPIDTQNNNLQAIDTAVTGFCEGVLTNSTDSSLENACIALNTLSAEDKVAALDTISPEEVVAEFTSTINMTKDQTGNLSNRLNALRGGATGVSVAGLNYIQGNDVLPGSWLHEMANQVGGNASADQNFSPIGFFINGSITSGEKDSTNNERGYDLDGDSITLGVDYRFSNSLVAGVAYGSSNSEIEFSSTNEITNEIDNLLAYGSWYKDAFYIDAVLGFADGEIETDRLISFTGTSGTETVTVEGNAEGKTESSQIFFSLAGNYDFSKGAWTYGPYASLDVIDGEIEGYDEIGSTGFEVAFDDQDIESQVLTFGGRAQYAWSQPWGIVVPHARVEWKNELNDDRDAIVGRFVLDTSNDSQFSIQADDLDESWFQIGLGVSATFQHGLSAYIDYETVVSYDDTEIDTVSFGGRWETKF